MYFRCMWPNIGNIGFRNSDGDTIYILAETSSLPTSIMMSATTTSSPIERSTKDRGQKEATLALQAISQGVLLPGIPSFTSVDRKRRWMLEHMAGAFRVFGRYDYGRGMGGHISLREPEHRDKAATPSNRSYDIRHSN